MIIEFPDTVAAAVISMPPEPTKTRRATSWPTKQGQALMWGCWGVPVAQKTYVLKELFIEIIGRNPKKVGLFSAGYTTTHYVRPVAVPALLRSRNLKPSTQQNVVAFII